MEQVFANLGKLLYDENGHKGFIVKWNLVSPLCKQWSRNRDADKGRVAEMIDFHQKGGYIPRIVHLADVIGEGLVCYDGNHRREVFNRCAGDADLICIVDVMFGATQRDVYKAFNNINKSVQLPAIYLDDGGENNKNQVGVVKDEILALVKTYEAKYKAFLSTSPRCHAPHFNRDAFVDNVYAIYKAFDGAVGIAEIGGALEKLNAEYAGGRLCRPHAEYKASVVDKCKKVGLWLFLERTIPVAHVRVVLG